MSFSIYFAPSIINFIFSTEQYWRSCDDDFQERRRSATRSALRADDFSDG